MKNKTNKKNYSGIVICDSITMSVKQKRPDRRWYEAVLIAVIGFVSVIMSFLEMFDFNYSVKAVTAAAIIFSAVHIALTRTGRKNLIFAGISLGILAIAVTRYAETVKNGFKYVYNIIYSDAMKTDISYYKFLPDDEESYCVTVFFIFCIWLLSVIIYTFTIHRPNPVLVVLCTFPIIEIGLYHGISIPVFWGILTIAYWLALLAICNTDLGEYSGGSGGFVRKENLFFPKRQMRLKVTEKCALFIMSALCIVTVSTLAFMKLSDYKRSDALNQKRTDIKMAVNSFSVDDLASSISAITESFGFTFDYEVHKLGTVSNISYKNVTDLVATIDKKYEGAVYLKGYTGAVYSNNEWTELKNTAYTSDADIFGDFKKYGIYPQDFPHLLCNTAVEGNSDITLWINAKRKKNKSYAPYGTDNFGDMVYTNDTSVSSKKNGQTEYSYKFTGIDIVNIAELLGTKNRNVYSASKITDTVWRQDITDYCSDNSLFSYNDYFAIDNELNKKYFTEDKMYGNAPAIMSSLLENRYRKFVYANYLQLPDNDSMDEIRSEFADILDSASGETAADKLETLQQLRDKVSSMTTYSLSPGKTPSNRDFVNYFLLENKQGYCIHYASSGVLLARMAGIPARYATGYIMVSDDFNNNSKNKDGTYTVQLKDNRSHAWTEVYLDGFGWVPFEFTAGYSSNAINTETTTATTTATEQTKTTTVSTGTRTTGSTNEKTTAEKSSTAQQTSEVTTTLPAVTTNASGHGGFGKGISTGVLYTALIISAIAALCLIIYLRRCIILKVRKKRFTTGSPERRVEYIYYYTERLLALMKIHRDNRFYTEFAEYVEGRLGEIYFEKGDFRQLVETALLCSFGNAPAEKAAADFAADFAEKFSHKIYSKSNLVEKFLMRFITVLY